MRAGFSGGMVVDYPNSSKAKKSVWVSLSTCAVFNTASMTQR